MLTHHGISRLKSERKNNTYFRTWQKISLNLNVMSLFRLKAVMAVSWLGVLAVIPAWLFRKWPFQKTARSVSVSWPARTSVGWQFLLERYLKYTRMLKRQFSWVACTDPTANVCRPAYPPFSLHDWSGVETLIIWYAKTCSCISVSTQPLRAHILEK